MSIQTAYSSLDSPAEAVAAVKKQLGSEPLKLLLFFASTHYDPTVLAQAINDEFPTTLHIGCTTAGEITSGLMLEKSLVVMAFGTNALADVSIQLVSEPANPASVAQALKNFEQHFNEPIATLDVDRYVGLVLVDGMSGAEETLMERLGDATDVLFVGGSAGDDLAFKATWVFSGGRAHANAAVLAILRPTGRFGFIKTQSFITLPKKLVATQVDEPNRRVLEFDGKPAAVAYAEALSVSVADASEQFMRNPVGLMAGDEPFVRSPQRFDGNAMVFYCNVKEGMELSLLESRDIVEDTTRAIETKQKEFGAFSAIVNFNCILRTLELKATGQMEAYGKIFAGVPTIGFSTYGEEFLGHINQTATMLVFAR